MKLTPFFGLINCTIDQAEISEAQLIIFCLYTGDLEVFNK